MSKELLEVLARLEPVVAGRIRPLAKPYPACTLFLSVSDGSSRARVFHAAADSFCSAWQAVVEDCLKGAADLQLQNPWVRVDWVAAAQQLQFKQLRDCLKTFKRNYFRFGLALDDAFETAFIEQELNANAMLYGGVQCHHAVLNERNFSTYARKRFAVEKLLFPDDGPVYLLTTGGVFGAADCPPRLLHASGRNAGRRRVDALDSDLLHSLIQSGSRYLMTQVQDNGRFHYGWHPCFDRPINTYNSLRHASTLYAMLEAWEITRDSALMAGIERAMSYLLEHFVKQIPLDNGERAAFVIDMQDEIKLGGSAVCILMLAKYTELTGSNEYLALLEALATGIVFMQDKQSGQFVHVLNYPDLSVKEAFRVIYYNGEAAFALMRLFKLTAERRWIDAVEKAFDYFIAAKHWQYHDHWLSYCVNELTLYRPCERYYRFGIMNVADHLDFVEQRLTTFPTLLELMMAAKAMIERLQSQPALAHLLKQLDLVKFDQALEARAKYLLNGHFWPEFAMFFHNPARIVGSFFIRHHAFRIRIDDVEHYLSGYVAYLKHLEIRTARLKAPSAGRRDGRCAEGPGVDERRCVKLKNFKVDLKRLRAHFIEHVQPQDATNRSEERGYTGWGTTRHEGSFGDDIPPEAHPEFGELQGVALKAGVCHGYLAGLLVALKMYGLSLDRTPYMRLERVGCDRPFQGDEDPGGWQLHIPIEAGRDCLFEWVEADGDVGSVQLPADGSIWLVRVDVRHRLVMDTSVGAPAVHLVMGLREQPGEQLFA